MVTDRRRFLRLSAVGASGLAGCTALESGGGGGGGGGDSEGPPEPTVLGEERLTDEAAQDVHSDYRWGEVLAGAEPTRTDRVTVPNTYSFDPLIALVGVGETLVFDNTHNLTHTIDIPRLGFKQRVVAGRRFAVQIDVPGDYDYVCTQHQPTHLGRIVVRDIGTDGAAPTEGGARR